MNFGSNKTNRKSRLNWSEAEDCILRTEVFKQAHNAKGTNWRSIAAQIPRRSNKDCRKRWIKLDNSTNKGPWNQEEDQRLRDAVNLYSNAWTEIAQMVGTRNADQCAKRWIHFLNPDLDHSAWTEEEDIQLLAEVEKNGRNWRMIVDQVFPGRSATDAKNRFTILQRSGPNKASSVRRLRFKAPFSLSETDNQIEQPDPGPIEDTISSLRPILDFDSLNNNLMSQVMVEYGLGTNSTIASTDDNYMMMLDWNMPNSILLEAPDSSEYGLLDRSYEGFNLGTTDDRNRHLVSQKIGCEANLGTTSQHPTMETLNNIWAAKPYEGCSSQLLECHEQKSLGTCESCNSDDDDDDENCCDDDKHKEVTRAIDQFENECISTGHEKPQNSPGLACPSDPMAEDYKQKRSTMVLRDVKPELITKILSLLYSSDSVVDVKIFT